MNPVKDIPAKYKAIQAFLKELKTKAKFPPGWNIYPYECHVDLQPSWKQSWIVEYSDHDIKMKLIQFFGLCKNEHLSEEVRYFNFEL